MTGRAQAVLAAVASLPAATLEVDGAQRAAAIRVGVRLVAFLDLGNESVSVYVPAEMIPTLQRAFPTAQPTQSGVAFDLNLPESCPQAVAAIRKRVHVERFVWQLRAASP